MAFVSVAFLLLFLITYILCRKISDERKRHIVLLGASLLFCGYWDFRFPLFLLVHTAAFYFLGRKIEREKKKKKFFLYLGLLLALGTLGIFKYLNFFLESIYLLIGAGGYREINILLPIGISYYTLQAVSYVTDVYKGRIEAEQSWINVALYLTFFPKFLAGPISKTGDFFSQLRETKKMDNHALWEGFQIFLFGMFKKVVIADRLAVGVDAVFQVPELYSGLSIAWASILYIIQLYCDFSGYSDMAVGVAKAFGYRLERNFNLPYISRNMSEMWKRWHISLSSWLMEYVYIPLGGNRKGKARTFLNLMLVMLIGGLWHGASWNFVLWGALQGAALCVHKAWRGKRKEKNGIMRKNKLVEGLSICMTIGFWCISFVPFRASSIEETGIMIMRIFTCADGISYFYTYGMVYLLLVAAAIVIAAVRNGKEGFYVFLPAEKASSFFWIFLVIFLIMLFFYGGDSAFIYAQF